MRVKFNGTLYICPCANPLALEIDYEFYPEREDLSKLDNYFYSEARHGYCVFGLGRKNKKNAFYNMNRSWNQKGNYGVAGNITRWLWQKACQKSDAVLDFHCAQTRKPYISCPYPFPASFELASVFGIEAVYRTDYSNVQGALKGVLAYQANINNILSFSLEFSKQHRLHEADYAVGKKGVLNTMKALGMIKKDIILEKPVYLVKYENIIKLSSKYAGHIHYFFDEYAPIRKGDVVYEIRNLQTLDVLDRAISPVNGIMGTRTHRPVSRPSERICSVIKSTIIHRAGAQG